MKDLKFASVIIEHNIDKALDYSIPESLHDQITEGMLVEVPLKGKLIKGYIISLKDTSEISNVLEINRIVSKEVISQDLFSLALWMSKYYCCSLSKILKSIIPTSIRKEINPKYNILLTTTKTKEELLTILKNLLKKNPKQAKALEFFLKTEKKIYLNKLLSLSHLTKAPIDSLIRKKILIPKKVFFDEADILNDFDYFKTKKKNLNDQQQLALNKINNSIEENKFETHLIHGITGSGKTEVYLQAIENALKKNKSAIMMVPEISLTTQTIERFRSRFSEKIAIFHHKRSKGEKSLAWESILNGDIRIVIGARSSIFCPLKNLGLIIVDEEDDPSYKQTSEMPTYNAKHVAIMRGKFTNACVVLGSATPSIESYYNALCKKYVLSVLPNRTNNSTLAKVKIIDMKIELLKSKSYFSEELLKAIKQRFEKGEQVLLFLNRRGYHTSLQCLKCDYIFKCKHCDITYTYHKKENFLSCHLCGSKIPILKNCPNCNSSEFIKYKGFGTEHIQFSLNAIFPNIRTIRIDRDTTTTKDSHESLFKQFRAGKADVLIGTQMIVKGLHYPTVTLVGILNTDSALNIPDFRSSEKVFQLVTQACGRSGRDNLEGEVIIQSFMPENETIKFASNQDYLSFYENEIKNRKLFDYPPFCQMIKIVFSSPDEEKAKSYAIEFRKIIINNLSNDYKIHPVLPSGRLKTKDVYKYQFLIRGKSTLVIVKMLENIKKEFKKPNSVSLFIDVDPIDTYY
jgi:primosomal protein N' (replication factor Y) (superfamily II helicase)